jgi:hypothetical protein
MTRKRVLKACRTCIHMHKVNRELFCKLTGKKCSVNKFYIDDDCANQETE